jgi:hypothetical protein
VNRRYHHHSHSEMATKTRIALVLALLSALFLAAASVLDHLGSSVTVAYAAGPASRIQPAFDRRALQTASEPHFVHIPYFTELEGMHSTLTLNNNLPDPMTTTVTIFNHAGEAFVATPIVLAPQSVQRFSLKQLTEGAPSDFNSGNVQVFFQGPSMAVTSQVSIVSDDHRLSFESTATEAMGFSSSTLDGIVWVPDDDTNARVALTNASSGLLSVAVTEGQGAEERLVTLNPHETSVVDMREFVRRFGRDASATLVTLRHNGPPGALIATGFAVNIKTGFSCSLNFLDRSTAKTNHLAGAHFRFGKANVTEGFPRATTFSAPLVLANTGDTPTRASILVDYTVGSQARTISLGTVTIAAGKLRQLDLAAEMSRRGISGPVEDAGIDINYNGPVGSVIARLSSIDTSGDFSFDVPVKDPKAEMLRVGGSHPWRLDAGYTTVVHLKNFTDKTVNAMTQIRYDGGAYHPDMIKLAPFQTVALNIKDLRDSQKPDIRGGVLPGNVNAGQVVWFERELGSLIGRAVIASIPKGIASTFSCTAPCDCPPNFFSASLAPTTPPPSTFTGVPGVLISARVTEIDKDCYNNTFGPYNVNVSNWITENPAVATISGQGVFLVGSGTCSVRGQFSATVYGFNCTPITINPSAAANVAVSACQTPTGETTAARGWLDTIALFDMTLTPTSTNFANRVVSEQNPGGGSDTCWFSGSLFPAFTSITGGSWTIESGNRYGYDAVGVFAEVVNYYRSNGRAPCQFTLPQRMVIICPSIAVPYVTNTLVIQIGTTTITTSRAEASQTKTWP